jgi:hypothetical protein
MYAAPFIYQVNPAWKEDHATGLFKQVHGNLYTCQPICEKDRLKWLHARGLRLVVWNGYKSEYMRMPDDDWKPYVEVIPSLDEFLGRRLRGEPAQ